MTDPSHGFLLVDEPKPPMGHACSHGPEHMLPSAMTVALRYTNPYDPTTGWQQLTINQDLNDLINNIYLGSLTWDEASEEAAVG